MTDQPIEPPAEIAAPASSGQLGRQLSREVVLYTVGTVVANGVLYLSVPIYTRIFDPGEYSQFTFVTTVVGLLAGVLLLGGDTALARFWFQDEEAAARRRLATTWLAFLAATALTVCLILLPLTSVAARYTLEDRGAWVLFAIALAMLPVQQASRMTAQILRNEFRPTAFVVTGVALGLLSLGCGLAFVAGGLGITGIFLGLLTAEALVLVARVFLTRDMLAGPLEPARLPALLRFGVPLVPVTLSFWVFTSADRIVVQKIAGGYALGVYGVAVTVTMVFVVLSQAVSTAWLPRVVQAYEHDAEEAGVVVSRVLTYYVFGLGLLAVTFSALAPELTAVLAGPKYAAAATAIPLLCMGAVANGSQTVTATGLTLTHRTGRLAVISFVVALVNVLAAIALVRTSGIVGAAGASLIGYGILTVAFLWASQRAWPIRLELRRLAVIVALLTIMAVVTTRWQDAPLLLRSLLPVAFLAGALVLGGLRSDERLALSRLRVR